MLIRNAYLQYAMPLITSIRRYFRLDKEAVCFKPSWLDAVGLYINEQDEIMKEQGMDCLLLHKYVPANVNHTEIPAIDFHLDASSPF